MTTKQKIAIQDLVKKVRRGIITSEAVAEKELVKIFGDQLDETTREELGKYLASIEKLLSQQESQDSEELQDPGQETADQSEAPATDKMVELLEERAKLAAQKEKEAKKK